MRLETVETGSFENNFCEYVNVMKKENEQWSEI